ncbi:aminotransferase class IV [Thermaurantiacus sp.]
MSAQAYVNGSYAPLGRARIAIEDRGLQFGDSVYEVVAVLNRSFLDWEAHLWRLARNCAALRIEGTPAASALLAIARRLVLRARLTDGLLYLQVTRGAAPRDHGFPAAARPTLIATARAFDFRKRVAQQTTGVALLALPDQRWLRGDIKSTNLLGAVLAKQEAREAGAFEALLHLPDGTVTEGGSTNIWMVTGDGLLVTPPLSGRLLGGIMRQTVLRLARAAGLPLAERTFTLAEAEAAAELFLTSTTAPVLPVVRLSGRPVGAGIPGPVTGRLIALLREEIARQTGWRP